MNKKGKPTMAHKDDVKSLLDAMHNWYGIDVPEEMVNAICAKTPKFVEDVNDCGVDTCVREWFVDLLGKHLGIEGRWPLNMDSKEYSDIYFVEFKRRGLEAGITFHGKMWEGY